jgi:hypothetical protein
MGSAACTDTADASLIRDEFGVHQVAAQPELPVSP